MGTALSTSSGAARSSVPSIEYDMEADQGKEDVVSALYRMEQGLRDALWPRYVLASNPNPRA